MVVAQAERWGKWGEVGKRVQTFGSKINKVVVATRFRKQTHSEGQCRCGVQFITQAGPRQSLPLAKDPDQFL